MAVKYDVIFDSPDLTGYGDFQRLDYIRNTKKYISPY